MKAVLKGKSTLLNDYNKKEKDAHSTLLFKKLLNVPDRAIGHQEKIQSYPNWKRSKIILFLGDKFYM